MRASMTRFVALFPVFTLFFLPGGIAQADPLITLTPDDGSVTFEPPVEILPNQWQIEITNTLDDGPVSIEIVMTDDLDELDSLLVNLPDAFKDTFLTVRGDDGADDPITRVGRIWYDGVDHLAGGDEPPTTRARLIIEGLYTDLLDNAIVHGARWSSAHEVIEMVVTGDVLEPIIIDRSVAPGGGTFDARVQSFTVGGSIPGTGDGPPASRDRITVHGTIENMTVGGSMGSTANNRAFTLHCIELQNLHVLGEMRGMVDTTYTGVKYGTGEQGLIRSLRVEGDLSGTLFGLNQGNDPDLDPDNDAVRTGVVGTEVTDLGLSIGDDLIGKVIVKDQVSRPIDIASRLEHRIIIDGDLESSITVGSDAVDAASIEITGVSDGTISIVGDSWADLIVGLDVTAPVSVQGSQFGPIQIGDALEDSLDIGGDLEGDLEIGGDVTAPVTVLGDSTGQIHIGGGLKDVLDIGGDSDGAIDVDQSVLSVLRVGQDLNAPVTVDDRLNGAAIVTGDVSGDISIGTKLDGDISVGGALFGDIMISQNEGLEGQIIINAEDNQPVSQYNEFWFGNVVVAGTTLGPVTPPPGTAPGYTVLSTDLGGGAVGLARFDFHRVESNPKNGSKMSTPPAFAELVFYGPVELIDDNPDQIPVIVERAGALVTLPWGCTSPCDPGCEPLNDWADVSSQFLASVSGRTLTVSGLFENGYRYRVRSRQGAGDRIACVGVEGSPTVRFHTPGTAGCPDGNYVFSVVPVMPLDLSGDGRVSGEDLLVWAETPTDVDQSETADIVDLVILADAVE